ncbi:Blp family class II bacteriocin [Alteromonas halophila]|uniref:Bacteriocin n=1 Tax=Alteromonas halophila TaxID=516698 RepID=A0A918MXR8_9ALTE|nr:Blp family class II bacteriocin [Alteromonas halophila]GGW83297.1 hypothetical protein GCM10007391_15890 [Alteromonas halophila]
MRDLQLNELINVNGGCAEHCWGDFEAGDLAAVTIGGIVAGSAGGPAGAAAGGAGAALAYLLGVVWTEE